MTYEIMKPKSQATKAKLDKWGYIKLKSYCPGKETLLTEWKGNPWKREKYISDKGLKLAIYKGLL